MDKQVNFMKKLTKLIASCSGQLLRLGIQPTRRTGGANERHREFSPYKVGLHLPYRLDAEVEEEGALR